MTIKFCYWTLVSCVRICRFLFIFLYFNLKNWSFQTFPQLFYAFHDFWCFLRVGFNQNIVNNDILLSLFIILWRILIQREKLYLVDVFSIQFRKIFFENLFGW